MVASRSAEIELTSEYYDRKIEILGESARIDGNFLHFLRLVVAAIHMVGRRPLLDLLDRGTASCLRTYQSRSSPLSKRGLEEQIELIGRFEKWSHCKREKKEEIWSVVGDWLADG